MKRLLFSNLIILVFLVQFIQPLNSYSNFDEERSISVTPIKYKTTDAVSDVIIFSQKTRQYWIDFSDILNNWGLKVTITSNLTAVTNESVAVFDSGFYSEDSQSKITNMENQGVSMMFLGDSIITLGIENDHLTTGMLNMVECSGPISLVMESPFNLPFASGLTLKSSITALGVDCYQSNTSIVSWSNGKSFACNISSNTNKIAYIASLSFDRADPAYSNLLYLFSYQLSWLMGFSVPIIDDITFPSSQNYHLFTEGESMLLTLDINCTHPRWITVHFDTQVMLNTSFLSSTFIHDFGLYTRGTYNISIQFFGLFPNQTTQIELEVEYISDNDKPFIFDNTNQSFVFNTGVQFLQWSIFDTDPGSYSYFIDSYLLEEGSWESGSFLTPVYTSEIGLFNYTLEIKDSSNNSFSRSIFVQIVQDLINPERISKSGNASIELGQTSPTLNWIVFDDHPNHYTIYYNGTLNHTETWETNQILYTPPVLTLGSHNFTILLVDESGLVTKDTIFITVESDKTNPIVSAVEQLHYLYENDPNGLVVSWHLSDLNPKCYTIFQDNVLIKEETQWLSNEIHFTVQGLPFGSYNFTLFAEDTFGNKGSDTLVLFVIKNNSLVISEVNAIIIDEKSNISLKLTDGIGNLISEAYIVLTYLNINYLMSEKSPGIYNTVVAGSATLNVSIYASKDGYISIYIYNINLDVEGFNSNKSPGYLLWTSLLILVLYSINRKETYLTRERR